MKGGCRLRESALPFPPGQQIFQRYTPCSRAPRLPSADRHPPSGSTIGLTNSPPPHPPQRGGIVTAVETLPSSRVPFLFRRPIITGIRKRHGSPPFLLLCGVMVIPFTTGNGQERSRQPGRWRTVSNETVRSICISGTARPDPPGWISAHPLRPSASGALALRSSVACRTGLSSG